jgi:hypothetical protein
MNKGIWLAVFIVIATAALVIIGTLWPIPIAAHYAGGRSLLRPSTTPEAAVRNLADQVRVRDWGGAYSSLANKAEFTEPEFVHDFTGYDLSLRTYATLGQADVRPLHATADQAKMRLTMHWSTVVGSYTSVRDLQVVKDGDRWRVDWPLAKKTVVPPQVIPVTYLRWDVIYRGAEDDWAAQNVQSPNVRIVDMRPVQRASGVVVMGELLNDDVVPAHVSVRATLLSKSGSPIASEGSFDNISHQLLPRQVTPFLIDFPNTELSKVGSIRMDPISTLISTSAGPVIEIQNQQFHPGVNAALTGQLVNQGGQTVNIAHVLGTFYDKSGHLVWVAGEYVPHALLPKTPVPFDVRVPEDLASNITSERVVVATYRAGGIH